MSRVLVLACGNTLRGDDGVAPYIAKRLRSELSDPETEIRSDQQWAPELAELISQSEAVIFVDASASLPPGEIACQTLKASRGSAASLTHQTSPAVLLALAGELYGKYPARAFLLTIGGSSFELTEKLSEPVRVVVPEAIERIKEILLGKERP